jgi:hypothetical protein
MSQKLNSTDYQIMKYLINPKSASILSNPYKTRAPDVRIDYLMRKWGLISGNYRNDGTIQSTNSGKIYQIFSIIYSIYYCIKIFIAMNLSDNSVWIYYIGDPSTAFMNMFSRIYLQIVLFLVTLKSFFMLLYYYFNQNTGRLSWIGNSQSFKGKNTETKNLILKNSSFF